MPKFLKDTKIEIWTETEGGVTKEGIPIDGEKVKVADIWASVRGMNMSEYYAHHSIWPDPVLEFTFTRPGFEITLSHHVKHGGKFYRIVDIDQLTNRPHSDMRIRCNFDKLFDV